MLYLTIRRTNLSADIDIFSWCLHKRRILNKKNVKKLGSITNDNMYIVYLSLYLKNLNEQNTVVRDGSVDCRGEAIIFIFPNLR